MIQRFSLFAGFIIPTLIAGSASAQPIFTEVHSWYISTEYGLIGYREMEINGVSRQRTLHFGPFGTLNISRATFAIAIIVFAGFIVISCLFYFVRVRRRRIIREKTS
jgi:hypothetical protein